MLLVHYKTTVVLLFTTVLQLFYYMFHMFSTFYYCLLHFTPPASQPIGPSKRNSPRQPSDLRAVAFVLPIPPARFRTGRSVNGWTECALSLRMSGTRLVCGGHPWTLALSWPSGLGAPRVVAGNP